MPTIRSSEQGRRLARRRWERQHQREAEAAEAWADDPLSFVILTKAEQDHLLKAVLRQGAEGALAQVARSVVLACAELGIDRATAERLGDLAALFVAVAIERNGCPEVEVPAPETWRGEVAWDALYGPDGGSLVTGAIARESAAEMAEAGGD